MDSEGEISVWKGSRAKGFDQMDERVAVGWKAFEKRGPKCTRECLFRAGGFDAFLPQECLDTFPSCFVGQFKSEDGRVTNNSIAGQ